MKILRLAFVQLSNIILLACECHRAPVIQLGYSMSIETAFNFYLIPLRPATVFTGQISQTPTNPFVTLSYANGVTGSFSPLEGMTTWFGTSSNDNDVGILRLRQWSPNGTNGTIKVAESDDVGPLLVSGTFITIKHEWRLWSIYPNITQNNGSVTFFEDFDIAYNQQTVNWFPQAVAGPPGVSFLSGGQATVSFVGDQSMAHAVGATITSFLWESPESNEGSSSSQGTKASPVIFTYTSLGSKRVALTTTDSNGNTDVNYTWAFIIDPDNLSNAYLDFERASDSGDFAQGGGQMNFITHEGADTDDFPEEGLVVLATDKNLSTTNGYWPFRENVHFVGYVVGDSVRQDPTDGDVNFRATTLDGVMRKTTMFPISMTDRIGPADWTMAKNLTVDRMSSYLIRWRSSMHFMANVIFSDYSGLINRQNFGFESLYQMFSTLMSSAWGKAVCDHQSVFRITIDLNLRLTAERNTPTLKTLQKGIWIDSVGIEERSAYLLPANQCKMSGVAYPGNEVTDLCPLFSEAPGGVPKYFGRELNFDRLILTNQDDLNIRSGFGLAQANPKFSQFNIRFINDGDFSFSTQDTFPLVIESNDNDRGISFSGNVICRGFSRIYNNQNGSIITDAQFEPVTTGPIGTTVVIDCTPPPQKQRSGVGNTPEDTPDDTYNISSGKVAITSSSIGSSFYFLESGGQSWIKRVNGLIDINFNDMNPDAWTYFKQGNNINKIILWGCGDGFIARTEDTGQAWVDRITDVPNPPNSFGDPSGTTNTELNYVQIESDIFRENNHYLLAENQNTSDEWRAYFARSTDDGFNWAWFGVSGSEQVRPLRFFEDRQNGNTIWVTTWEFNLTTGSMWLREYDTTNFNLTSKLNLGDIVTEQQIEDKLFDVNPFSPLGNRDEIFLYGRMNNPQSVTGTVQIIESNDGGSSFSALINDWGNDRCGALLVSSEDNSLNRAYFAVRQ